MMQTSHLRSRSAWIILSLVGALLSGCVFAARPRWQAAWNDPWRDGWLDPGVPAAAPMPPAAAQLNASPVGVGGAGQTWVDGHYEWRDQQYTWVQGHWANPPQPGWVWQQPAWHQNQWHRGYWHDPNAPVDNVYVQGAAHAPWNGHHALPIAQPVTLSSGSVIAQPAHAGGAVGSGGTAVGPVATPVR
jgi:hypothetical protein